MIFIFVIRALGMGARQRGNGTMGGAAQSGKVRNESVIQAAVSTGAGFPTSVGFERPGAGRLTGYIFLTGFAPHGRRKGIGAENGQNRCQQQHGENFSHHCIFVLSLSFFLLKVFIVNVIIDSSLLQNIPGRIESAWPGAFLYNKDYRFFLRIRRRLPWFGRGPAR